MQQPGTCPPQPPLTLEAFLTECVRRDASDLHLYVDHPPYYRVQGQLLPEDAAEAVDAEALQRLVSALTHGIDDSALHRTGSLDGALTGPDGTRFRFNVFRCRGQLAVALRRLEDRFRPLEELGLPTTLYDLADLPDGLVIVAGPTGAGKSTTLATLIDRINQRRRCHVITIEDPVEYVHASQQALVHQRQIGSDASSFNEALVASLRQDPDVVLVGEIREIDTIRTAITASETGHLVLTTVHAGDCVGVIERLVSVFPAEEQPGMRRQLSLVLRAIVTQHLLIADGPAALRRGAASEPAEDETQRIRSRVVVSEVLRITPAVANLVSSGKSSQIYSTMESGASLGMQTLEQDLARLLLQGTISEAAALAYARSPAIVTERVARLRGRAASGGGAALARGGAR